MATKAPPRKKSGRKPGKKVPPATPLQRARRVEQAVDSVGENGKFHPVPEREWLRLREDAWALWAELSEVKDWPSAELRAEGFMPSPPDSAVHDGIVGRALRWVLQAPTGDGQGPYDARPILVKLAEEGLKEVNDFRKQRPAAARSIAKPLKLYEGILRELKDRPEYGLAP
jgi:hypothetical protein